jgi:hypothetical protein
MFEMIHAMWCRERFCPWSGAFLGHWFPSRGFGGRPPRCRGIFSSRKWNHGWVLVHLPVEFEITRSRSAIFNARNYQPPLLV